jgi:hypothetical protein
MKTIFRVICAMVLVFSWEAIGFSQQGDELKARSTQKISPQLWSKVQEKGTLRVIVSLNVPVQPIGQLSREGIVAQQERITAAQDELIANLSGTTYKVARRFTMSSGMALSVGPEALAILEGSPLVKKVAEDIAMSPN